MFDETFSADELDAGRWFPYYLPHWSSRARSAARYDLPGDRLVLRIDRDQPPWCPEHDGEVRVSSIQTGCFAGPLGDHVGQHRFSAALRVTEEQPTLRLCTPHHGRIETRLRALAMPGYMTALWLIGFEERPEESGELCVCEIFGEDVGADTSTIGWGIHPFGDRSLREDFHRDEIPIDASEWNVYAADWRPGTVELSVNGTVHRVLDQAPDYPMQLMLSLYELPSRFTSSTDRTSWPKTIEVDHVRVVPRA